MTKTLYLIPALLLLAACGSSGGGGFNGGTYRPGDLPGAGYPNYPGNGGGETGGDNGTGPGTNLGGGWFGPALTPITSGDVSATEIALINNLDLRDGNNNPINFNSFTMSNFGLTADGRIVGSQTLSTREGFMPGAGNYSQQEDLVVVLGGGTLNQPLEFANFGYWYRQRSVEVLDGAMAGLSFSYPDGQRAFTIIGNDNNIRSVSEVIGPMTFTGGAIGMVIGRTGSGSDTVGRDLTGIATLSMGAGGANQTLLLEFDNFFHLEFAGSSVDVVGGTNELGSQFNRRAGQSEWGSFNADLLGAVGDITEAVGTFEWQSGNSINNSLRVLGAFGARLVP